MLVIKRRGWGRIYHGVVFSRNYPGQAHKNDIFHSLQPLSVVVDITEFDKQYRTSNIGESI